jgi:O-acetyl-ADP-ribose deacetylase (regulator of RNase III)
MKAIQQPAPAAHSASLNRRHFLRTAGQGASVLTAASAFAPAVLSASADARTLGVGCIGIGTRGTPKCSTDEAFIETATFLMSLKAGQERRMVRWDPVREDIV